MDWSKVKVLELFKGTGSQGKACMALGVKPQNIVSVDIEPEFEPTHVADLLTFDYTQLDTPDIITASPPCETWSHLIRSHQPERRKRDIYTLEPLHPEAVIGEQLLFKTIEIINYFSNKNPNLRFVIENPQGLMKKHPVMTEEPITHMATAWYSCYGFPYRKPTNFWSNKPLVLLKGTKIEKQVGTKEAGGMTRNSKYKSRLLRYRMPESLCIDILKQLNS